MSWALGCGEEGSEPSALQRKTATEAATARSTMDASGRPAALRRVLQRSVRARAASLAGSRGLGIERSPLVMSLSDETGLQVTSTIVTTRNNLTKIEMHYRQFRPERRQCIGRLCAHHSTTATFAFGDGRLRLIIDACVTNMSWIANADTQIRSTTGLHPVSAPDSAELCRSAAGHLPSLGARVFRLVRS